jgi:hypothetical protein
MSDGFEQMKQFARYIDQNIKVLTEIAESGRYGALQPDTDDDLIADVGRSIDQQQSEINKMTRQIGEIEELGTLIKNARSAIDELKRYGILCDLPISIAPTDDRKAAAVVPERKRTPVASPVVQQPRKIPTTASEIEFREIDFAEYRSLPSIVPLLVKFEEMNKHYCNLVETGQMKFSGDELAQQVPLSNSRLNAFTRALISLERLAAVEEKSGTFYHLL